MKKHLVPLIAGCAAILLAAGSASAQVIANFSQGVGTDYASTQFVGKAGDGWNTAWAAVPTNATLTTSVTNVNPIVGTDNYLKVEINPTAVGNRSQLNRQFNDALASSAHTITFSIRFDSLNNFSASDYVGIFATQNAQSSTSTSAQTWGIYIEGKADQATSGQITFRAAESGAGQTVSTGIYLTEGVTYSFTLNIDPENKAWQATLVTSNSESFSSGTMGYRSQTAVGRTFNLNTYANNPSSGSYDWSYSFSGLSVIPEPSSMALLLGSVLFGAVALRRKFRS